MALSSNYLPFDKQLDFEVNVVSPDVHLVGSQLYPFHVVEQLARSDVVVPRMERAFHHFSVYLARRKRAILVAAERLDGVVLALCEKERDPRAVDAELLAAVLFDLARLGNLDRCQLLCVDNLAIKWFG